MIADYLERYMILRKTMRSDYEKMKADGKTAHEIEEYMRPKLKELNRLAQLLAPAFKGIKN